MLWIWSIGENRPDPSGSPLLAKKTKSKEANHSYSPAFSEATRKESRWCNRLGFVEILMVELFVTQQPNSPFGLSWYQADFETNNQGQGEVRARGIFSEELFVFAPGVVNAPQVDNQDARRTRSSSQCSPFILGCGSAPHRKPRMLGARPPSRSLTVTTRLASRRLAPAISPTPG
jgi:hypothetical protein